jgi:hypothetical protein
LRGAEALVVIAGRRGADDPRLLGCEPVSYADIDAQRKRVWDWNTRTGYQSRHALGPCLTDPCLYRSLYKSDFQMISMWFGANIARAQVQHDGQGLAMPCRTCSSRPFSNAICGDHRRRKPASLSRTQLPAGRQGRRSFPPPMHRRHEFCAGGRNRRTQHSAFRITCANLADTDENYIRGYFYLITRLKIS